MTFTPMNWTLAGAAADTDRDAFAAMTANLWTPEQISLADDAEDMRGLSDTERTALARIFAGLASVESLQATAATSALTADAQRHIGEGKSSNESDAAQTDLASSMQPAALTAIAFMESMHTKAYSTLLGAIDQNANGSEANNGNASTQSPFTWAGSNDSMQEKLRLLNEVYAATPRPAGIMNSGDIESSQEPNNGNDSANVASSTESAVPEATNPDSVDTNGRDSPTASSAPDLGALERLAAAVLAESLVVESGFYLPMWLSSRGMMTKTPDIIRLINRDIATSSAYLGTIYQRGLGRLDDATRETMRQYAYDLANNLYFAEEDYNYTLPYADLGLDDDIEKFLSLNANKALSYLGYPALFPAEISQPNPAVTDELSDMESVTAAFKSSSLFGVGSSALANAGFATSNSGAAGVSAVSSLTSTGATTANKVEETDDDDWDF
ncbi:ribonucleotide-diphosphate reductase subunit beta [Bifidobacterium sp. ESL0790]|uniref:ribonucleotide-diphosphate reductase subunit beta n=1 Tax=Bifidobacterium sp. ESL0790 TaxID=2983233 RepID=UPI0023F71529|nr:ribonucleotide-diphosphate reductase subunit beta [Bifidobacterium sp. ESL0790]WEV72358.1 ribonucleotide-diphosphate reductase subunit beta [Bifidobacterium sp. ESL0790]